MTTDTVTKDQSLAEIVELDTSSSRVFERFGLDYCCGGRQSLSEACAAAGIDADEVVAALAAAEPEGASEWSTMSPVELVDHLESTHHAYLHAELPRLQVLAEKVEGVHGGRHPELARINELTVALSQDLEPHLAKEEMILFPMIRELASATDQPAFHCGGIANPIRVMIAEHDRTGELLDEIRAATGDFTAPDDACTSYRALFDGLAEVTVDTHLHVHKENDVLFPAVLALADRLDGQNA